MEAMLERGAHGGDLAPRRGQLGEGRECLTVLRPRRLAPVAALVRDAGLGAVIDIADQQERRLGFLLRLGEQFGQRETKSG